MKIVPTQYTIIEIRDMMARKELVVNTTYQRNPNIWPDNAKSYFIDTILEEYPFPKIYVCKKFDTRRKRTTNEIVDGQQRVTTIVNFIKNEFSLTSVSKNYKGKRFDDLDEDIQEKFYMTPVHVDLILSSERHELLEMFRRINAYTVPLNPAEKRHSIYQGKFKWLINRLADRYSPLLEEYGVLTSKQILRMQDAELIAEFALVIDRGIINKSDKSNEDIYKKYEFVFPSENKFQEIISTFFEELSNNLNVLRGTFLMKPYALHSLFCAMTQKKYGIPGGEDSVGIQTTGFYYRNSERTIEKLTEIAAAHESQDIEGPYGSYVSASISTTHRKAQRSQRSKMLGLALR
jgi:hypothetical protein